MALLLGALSCGRSGEPTGSAPEIAPASEGSSPGEGSAGFGGRAPRDTPNTDRNAEARPIAEAQATTPPEPSAPVAPGRAQIARIETSMGVIRVQLDPVHAPRTVENFVQYVRDQFYDGTIFHRVIDDFMIQGGGFGPGMQRRQTRPPIALEIHPALRHIDGAIAMARTSDPNSATAQFYICDGPQNRLDDGYAPFGRTIEGMDVVRRIAAVQTAPGDRPVTDVVIRSIRMEQ